jgi:murein DD-endopeptidase MepM/ murein hydrolase activator NlpD
VYRVRAGDSLGGIARAYRTDTTRLADANDLGSSVLVPGQTIFIPGARLSSQEMRRVLGELVAWPIRGPISSYFGYRPNPFTGIRSFHAGIDIAANPGLPIRAAIEGKVADVGYNTLFGNYVILNHPDGMQTLYGHMTAYSVKRGQVVSQGSVIGTVGNTGYSTGPHLHFGLFKRGSAVNPLKYLK